MLNNLTNYPDLIRLKAIVDVPQDTDLITLGVRNPNYDGNYRPALNTYRDFADSILAQVPVAPIVLKGFHSPFPLASGQKTTAVLNGAISNSASFAERAIAVPYMPSQNITTSDLYINVSSLASGALARVYIYSDLNLYPDQLLYQSADINCSTNGTKTLTTTFNFVAGQVYWLVTHTSAGTQPQFTSSSSASPSLPIFRLSGATGFQTGQVVFTQITFANPVPTTFPSGGTLSTISAIVVGITKA